MKKIIFIISFLLAISYNNLIYANDTDPVINEQAEALGISSFIEESKNYTQDAFEDIDLNSLYKNALSGNVSLKGIPRQNSKSVFWRSNDNY
ncbi:MAG: hypothetical protein HFJ54_03595 [Clostridia bacterium]|nr:hypothetical protein [Clostridia bacterium]